MRNILKSKLIGGNIISAINSRAVSIVRYGAGIINWTKMELEELDLKTRKLMTNAREGRGLIGLEDCVQVEVH